MQSSFRLGDWLVEPHLDRLVRGDEEIKLQPKVTKVLVYLAEHAGEVISKEKIIRDVWEGAFVTDEVLANSIWELRKALGDDAHEPRFIQTVPKRGYRLIVDVRVALELGPLANVVKRARRRPWLLAGPAALAVLLLVGAALIFFWRPSPGGEAPVGGTKLRLAVLYFENLTGDPSLDWLRTGLADMLVTDLSQSSNLSVLSMDRLYQILSDMGRLDERITTLDVVKEVARQADVETVIVGSFMKAGDNIRINVRVQDPSSDEILATEKTEAIGESSIFVMVDDLTRRIKNNFEISSAEPEARPFSEVATASLEAYRLYMEGWEAQKNARFGDARKLMEEAVRIDPSFVMAYFKLYNLVRTLGDRDLADEYRRKVEAHLDHLSERERLFAQGHFARDDGNLEEGAEVLEKLVARYPDDLEGFVRLGMLYSFNLRDHERALRTMERGVRAGHKSGPFRNIHGYVFMAAGRYDEALREFEAYARLTPREPNPYDSQAVVYLLMGQPEKALERWSRALDVDPSWSRYPHFGMFWAEAMLGRYDEAMAHLEKIEDPFSHAFALSRVGRYREAEENLQRQGVAPRRREFLSAFLAIERGDYSRALEFVKLWEGVIRELSDASQKSGWTVLADLAGGVAEARSGDLAAARRRLDSQSQIYDASDPIQEWWHQTLKGEIALVEGDLAAAESAFSAGLPGGKITMNLSVVENGLSLRDGPARVKMARGDLAGAVEIYRSLNRPDVNSPWIAMLEPRYVLEVARLLHEMGDEAAAREEYEGFLRLWKDADPELPELEEARRYLAK